MKTYAVIWAVLLGLTGLSWASSLAALGGLELPVTLGIATVKATLVALYFMHLRHARFETRMVLVIVTVWMVLLIGLTTADVATRRTFPPAPDPAFVSER